MNKWILQGINSFSKSDFKQNVLVLRRVSFDVDWIENITKKSYKARGPPQHDIPTTTQSNEKLSYCVYMRPNFFMQPHSYQK